MNLQNIYGLRVSIKKPIIDSHEILKIEISLCMDKQKLDIIHSISTID